MLHIVLQCSDDVASKARYVFDTLLMAAGIPVCFVESAPPEGAFVLYSAHEPLAGDRSRCAMVRHDPDAWALFTSVGDVEAAQSTSDMPIVLGQRATVKGEPGTIQFDIVANAFYFLSSWSERRGHAGSGSRQSFENSVFARLGVPQDVVDRYLQCLISAIDVTQSANGGAIAGGAPWPSNRTFAVVLSHDVDYIPTGMFDTLGQGLKTVLRHLVRQHDMTDAIRSLRGLTQAIASGRDPYGCIPEIIAEEKALGVKSSFQVAVGRRHTDDVRYRIEDDEIRDYLRVIVNEEFDLCLHGSYRSTENIAWYVQEVKTLTERLGRPLGSRQHFLSFGYDALFEAEERAGIEYDMSMGYPDQIGPRAGFSYPYFPYCLDQDRPYDVLQISLFLMDVTLRSYMGLKGEQAWQAIERQLQDLQRKRGCASVVWHPIVFGGARDPGFDDLYWRLVEHVERSGGVATDGRTINAFWRERAREYESFARSPR